MQRREFLTGAGALAIGIRTAGAQEPQQPAGTLTNDQIKAEKSKAMQWHSERPITGSVPAHEHDFDVTPSDRMFVRNNLLTPVLDIKSHRLTLKGLVENELSWSVYDLAKQFQTVTIQGMLECAGSG